MDEAANDAISQLLERAGFGAAVTIEDAGSERGVFSTVWRVTLGSSPVSAIAKLPVEGPNGAAARASGAYLRELLAYQEILGGQPLHPTLYAAIEDGDNGVAFLLEDLGSHRAVDQLTGLGRSDVLAVVGQLAVLHHRFVEAPDLATLDVRRSAPSGFKPEQLAAGLDALVNLVDDRTRQTFASLLDNRDRLLENFDHIRGGTLCHGDPRADNLVFRPDGKAVLFDWQQLAIQHGEADLAWLLATSVATQSRPTTEVEALAYYSHLTGRSVAETTERYRLGLLLPALAVLLLAQRQTGEGRGAKMVETSIQRIAAAVVAFEVADAGNS